jgi:hypothetical protein
MADYEVLHLDQNEKVILEVRRHWIVFLNEIILFIFAVFSAVALMVIWLQYQSGSWQGIVSEVRTLASDLCFIR